MPLPASFPFALVFHFKFFILFFFWLCQDLARNRFYVNDAQRQIKHFNFFVLLLFWQLELLASIYAVYRGCWHWNSFQDNSPTPTHILTMVTRFLSLVFPHFPCIFLRLTQMILFVCGYVFIMWKLFLAPAEYLRYCDLDGFLWYSMWRILFNLVR